MRHKWKGAANETHILTWWVVADDKVGFIAHVADIIVRFQQWQSSSPTDKRSAVISVGGITGTLPREFSTKCSIETIETNADEPHILSLFLASPTGAVSRRHTCGNYHGLLEFCFFLHAFVFETTLVAIIQPKYLSTIISRGILSRRNCQCLVDQSLVGGQFTHCDIGESKRESK